MANNFGTAWIEVKVDGSNVDKQLKDVQKKVTSAVTGIEKSFSKSTSGSKTATTNNTALARSYNNLTKGMRAAQVANDGFRKGLRNGQGELKKTNKSMIALTAGILKSAPAFAVVTAAIAGVYQAIRILRDTITGGLSAVEDFKLKVASIRALRSKKDY